MLWGEGLCNGGSTMPVPMLGGGGKKAEGQSCCVEGGLLLCRYAVGKGRGGAMQWGEGEGAMLDPKLGREEEEPRDIPRSKPH